MINAFKNNILLNIKNIPGWTTKKKILIIECDDWGSIRMPSSNVYESLNAIGLNINTGRFNMYDTLETAEDLELLFDTLRSVRDRNGKHAVMTSVTNMANPDFRKIRSAGFSEYYYELFTDTLEKYYPGANVFRTWYSGMEEGLFVPELHGREHIAVQLWMEKLRSGNQELLIAFDHEFVSLDVHGVQSPLKEFRAEFYFTSDDQKAFLKKAIEESVMLYRKIFKKSPRVFVPANGIFHPEFDEVVARSGIKYLYVSHSMPYPVNGGGLKNRHFFPGQKGPYGLIYYMRNCAFEPTDSHYKGIYITMKQIESAFRWGKPASISTHRVNFVGGISPSIRKKGLAELKSLLNAIILKWPDVEFMCAGDALDHLQSTN